MISKPGVKSLFLNEHSSLVLIFSVLPNLSTYIDPTKHSLYHQPSAVGEAFKAHTVTLISPRCYLFNSTLSARSNKAKHLGAQTFCLFFSSLRYFVLFIRTAGKRVPLGGIFCRRE